MTKKLTHKELRQFTGSVMRYLHPLRRSLIYTQGVRHLADRGKAYWLIDAIASYYIGPVMQAAMQQDDRLESLHFWRLDVQSDKSASLTARADDGVTPFIIQEIPFTDFPLKQIDLWCGFDGDHWCLYLPSEH